MNYWAFRPVNFLAHVPDFLVALVKSWRIASGVVVKGMDIRAGLDHTQAVLYSRARLVLDAFPAFGAYHRGRPQQMSDDDMYSMIYIRIQWCNKQIVLFIWIQRQLILCHQLPTQMNMIWSYLLWCIQFDQVYCTFIPTHAPTAQVIYAKTTVHALKGPKKPGFYKTPIFLYFADCKPYSELYTSERVLLYVSKGNICSPTK